MANKQIKGLTVEIGGDTTKLGKALEAVEKKSSNLSTELGEINRLLKFDPGNADLLAQKQKVLADAVSNTKEKLDTLKKAEAQVQKQFERGEVSEEQVRALQREILATTKKLDGYEKAAKETADAVDKVGKASNEAEEGATDVKKGADKASKSLDDMADSADKAGESGEKMGSKLASAAKGGLAAVAAGAAAALGALVGSAEATREYRTEMGKLDTAFTTAGHSSEAAKTTYQALQGVLGETDQAVEASNHLAKLANNEEELAEWTAIATGVYATFGDSLPIENLTEAANETAKTGALTGGLADALNWAGVNEEAFQAQLDACTSEQERQALITETLNGLYSEAADKYRETNAEVIRANEANEAWTATMAEAGAAVEPILTDVKLLGASLLSDLMPGIVGVTDAFRGLLNGDEGAAGALGEALSGLLSQLLTKIVEIAPAVAEAAMSLLTTLVTTLVSMLPQLVQTGVQIIMSIIQGLTAAIPQIVQAIIQMIPQLVQALVSGIPQLIQGAVQLLLAIVQAIPLLIPPLVAAIPQIVMAIINGLLAALPQLIQGAVQFLMAIVQAIPVIINALVPQIPMIVTTLVNGLIENIPVLLEGAIQLLHAIVDAIPVIIDALIPQIPIIVNTIVSKLAEMAPVLLGAAVTLLWEIIKAIPQIVAGIIQNFPKIIQAIMSILGSLPSLIWQVFTKVLGKVGQWIGNMVTKAAEAGSKFVNKVIEFFKGLPGKIWTWLKNTVSRVASWGSELVSKGKDAAKKLVNAVVNGVKDLPGKILETGKNLVEGLWKGIKNATKWLKDKISGWVGNVTDFLMDLFGIHSPSKVTTWMGEMLDEGLAEGVDGNTAAPLRALRNLTDEMLGETDNLDGLTLERRVNHTTTPNPVASQAEGMLSKLDKIYQAILEGQVIMLDGKTLIGSTADGYDSELGQRRALIERGAL